MDDAPSSLQLADLRRKISRSFNLQDLQLLAHDLGVEFDNLSGSTLDLRAVALIEHFRRRGQLATLADALRRSRPNVEWPPLLPATYSPAKPPYLGLLPFTEADKDRFFGRDHVVAQLAGRLREHPFVALIGDSGSGKSSLLRAGLLPALKSGQQLADGAYPPPGSERWAYELLTPSFDPLERLAIALTPEGGEVAATRRELDEPAAMPRLIARLLTHRGRSRLLLLVDQFEEVFTLTHDAAARAAFAAALLAAARAGNAAVLIAFRADFYHRLRELDGLGEALTTAPVDLPRMRRPELRLAIEGPAALHGLRLEEGFVDTLLRDISGGPSQEPVPGALPLLSHVLLTTWNERGEGNALTHAAYREAGGVLGAVEKTAERTYGQLSSTEQATLRRLLTMRLSTCQEGVGFVRRRATLAELQPADPAQAQTVARVIGVMADAKLLTTGQDEQGREIVELAHEVLLTAWQKLRDWLVEDNQTAQLVQEVIRDAREWDERGRMVDELYRGGKLADARARLQPDQLGLVEQAFLAAGQEAEQRERTQRRRQRLLMGLAALLLVGLAAGLTIMTRRAQSPWEPLFSEAGVNSLAAADAGVYFGTEDGRVGLLDADDRWQILGAPEQMGSNVASPVIDYVAIDPVQPDHLYAAVRHDTVWASVDGGRTWAMPDQDFQNGIVAGLAVYDGRLAVTILPGEEPSVDDPKLLYLSADGGRTWTQAALACATAGAAFPPASADAVTFGPAGELLVGGLGGLYQVTAGQNCQEWSLVLPLGHVTKIVNVADGLLLIDRSASADSPAELYRWQPGQPLQHLAALEANPLYLANNPSLPSTAGLFMWLETDVLQFIADGQVSSLGQGPAVENDVMITQGNGGQTQLFLAHGGGLARYRQLSK